MSCRKYSLSIGPIVSTNYNYYDCSGNTISFLPTAGQTYIVIVNDTNPPISTSEVTVTAGDLADTTYYFSSCCGDFVFKVKGTSSDFSTTGFTIGTDILLFSDGNILYNTCSNIVTYSSGTTYPEVSGYYLRYQSLLDSCDDCKTSLGIGCPTYFKYCCCSGNTSDCYIGFKNLIGEFLTDEVYSISQANFGQNVCLQVVDPTSRNFYDVVMYFSDDTSISEPFGDCSNCIESNPCPVTPTPTPQYLCEVPTYSECDVLTIFPMGVNCSSTNPSSSSSYDGSITLDISGGTPPYSILWDNGSTSQTLTNLTIGSYSSFVTDYYGDFTAFTTCTLINSATPTPTPSPTPTPIPSEVSQLCMTITEYGGPFSPTIINSITFTPSGYLNGKPTWSGDSEYSTWGIYWNDSSSLWLVSGGTYSICSTTPSSPPLTNWVLFGTGTISVIEGACPISFFSTIFSSTNDAFNYNVITDHPKCGCDGSLLINVNNPTSSYVYSIDNGLTFKTLPIFNNLCSGTYNITVNDGSNTVNKQILLNPPSNQTTYTVSIEESNSVILNSNSETNTLTNFYIKITPELPAGTTISFDLLANITLSAMNSNLNANDILNNSGILLFTPSFLIYQNNNELSYTTEYYTGTTYSNTCLGTNIYQKTTNFIIERFTIGSGDIISGSCNNDIITNSNYFPSQNGVCIYANATNNFSISNLVIDGAKCSNVIFLNN